ncbi:hypothetical protein A9Q84_03200 [Halobacteriovorax marinus]|uniref:Membrane transport protein MMPL domain-containing protein n=1 Tax=Halobacteriovorax marinus TaxID=97084 RepID=A0A1Y5FGZ5_9BACT|nr:hypothetical protein A9Q84_03200 [Halobacteriovorax marinus]
MFILLFLGSLVFQFVYTLDLKQLNPESLFLTDEGARSLELFKTEYPNRAKLIAYKELSPTPFLYREMEQDAKALQALCPNECEVLLPHHLYKSREDFFERLKDQNFNEFSLITESSMGFVVLVEAKKEQLLKSLIPKLQSEYQLVGHPYTNYLLDESSKVVQEKLFPAIFALSLVILLLIVRNLKNSLILFLAPLFSSLLSLSAIKLFYKTMDMVSSIVPLICFVISLSIALHLYYSARTYGDFILAIKEKRKPILLMIVTTFIGFLALALSEIQVIRNFGYLSSTLIAVTSLISIFWFTSINSYFSFDKVISLDHYFKYPKKTLPLPYIILIFIISIALGVVGMKNIPIVTDATKYFSKKMKVKENLKSVAPLIGGIPLIEIIHKKSVEFNYGKFDHLNILEEKLQEATGLQVLSLNSAIKDINFEYAAKRALPADRFSYLALTTKIPKALRSSFQVDKSYYRTTLLGQAIDVKEYKILLEQTREVLKGEDYEVNGLYYNLMISQEEMVYTLLKSFLTSLLLMSGIVFFLFSNKRVFISFLLVNVTPVGLSLFLLWSFGLSLNIATVMTYSIGLGIVVDSSFHLFHTLNTFYGDFELYRQTAVKPIVLSSLILVVSFLLFGFYDFLPIREFGLSLSMIVMLGMLFDLFVLPTIFLRNHHLLGESHENL